MSGKDNGTVFRVLQTSPKKIPAAEAAGIILSQYFFVMGFGKAKMIGFPSHFSFPSFTVTGLPSMRFSYSPSGAGTSAAVMNENGKKA